ncbi:uncharacterized protein LOC117783733 [Drosophila innubila]|uniref:uncharacterized protein LOC117783733 n=1 Tax=Drosophila innubila TaxID=198719 RepID=UPI00148CA65F|nr:uncharacterized protein LOC117783733 [Drosophila innubila]
MKSLSVQEPYFQEGVYYKINKVECNGNHKYFANISCVLKPINWKRSILNVDCDIIGKMANANVIVEPFYRDSSNFYKPFSLQMRYDICQLLEKSKPNNFLERYALHHLRTHTNINHSCPYTGHLYARNFTLDEVSLPPLPVQQYKISFNFTQTNPSTYLGNVLLYFESREDYRQKKPKLHRN